MELNQRYDQLINLLNNINTEISKINDIDLENEDPIKKLPDTLSTVIIRLNTVNRDFNSYSDQLRTLVNIVINKFYQQINNSIVGYHADKLEKYANIYDILKSLLNELNRIDYLLLIRDNNVILIGGNGAGKSSFASYLKDSMSNNIVVIPAQKFLFYNKVISRLHLTTRLMINNIQKDNLIKRGKFENSNNDYDVKRFMEELTELFSKLVTVIANEQTIDEHNLMKQSEISQSNKNETILYKLNNLWKTLIPDIEFELDTVNRTLIPKKDGKDYSLNSLSDGEKAMLYYICHVFLAERNSFIVVDEPETFLNVSNFNRLWDTLESYREDCKFIYISHVIDFIITRSNADLLWCKSFKYPSEWEIKNIESEEGISQQFPKELLSEILGARKPILFCEGEKNSLDYYVYTSLFRNDAVICPVGGHTLVVQYTKAYNNSPILNSNKAYGIIDSDLMTDNEIQNLKNNSIYVLPFNEIEMVFFVKEVINRVLKDNFSSEEITVKINQFTSKFFEIVKNKKIEIKEQKVKKYLNTQLSNYRINNMQSGDAMISEIKGWLDNLNIKDFEDKVLSDIDRVINQNDYEGLLKISPQKKEISKGLANSYLDSQYVRKAVNQIKLDEKLTIELKTKYFNDIKFF
ncbi:Protein of unknown function [Alkalibacterium putridalgicola]|uniref:ABC transporter ATP-binding protein n=1 Tax=Alkalibacterium putridalgicola TaxID=426703 RepID=A0A1H7VMJ4_9LACT|nr:DUF4435 domain-containing protein [Alkalibacterium putridalgicola]GEK89426.1 ABC transporter ATP-binding protein [Alkalibacterium putridalgicola]SEM10129.1 Protein of unknown function [Alkalibacterium putridalgicola]